MADDHSTVWTQEAKLAYAAGIIDGEGCITIAKQPGGKTYRAYLQVGQSTKGWAVLEFMHKHFGGTISRKYQPPGNRQPSRIWYIVGAKAVAFLACIRPFMNCKCEQADVIARFGAMLDNLPRGSKGPAWTTTARATAATLHVEVAFLNGRGKAAATDVNPVEQPSPQKELFED